jgi:hypothetical protein
MALGPASRNSVGGVEILNLFGGLPGYPAKPNSEYPSIYLGSQSARDKLRGREGNNPDRLLRSQSSAQSLRIFRYCDSQDVGLEAATI